VTYIAPLAFVLLVTMGKEAYDDYKRNLRDREANSARYLILASHSSSDDEHLSNFRLEDNLPPTRPVPSSSIRVGDLVLLEKNQRVPADLVLLRTSDSSGTCFVRTDQLDGETDWKLRVAVPATQKLPSDQELLNLDAEIYGAPPLSRHRSHYLPLCFIYRYGAQRMRHPRTFTLSSARLRSTHHLAYPPTKYQWCKYQQWNRSQLRTCCGQTPYSPRALPLVSWFTQGQRRAQ
jgi:magnesium-transporting ATPase (P-type)